MWMRLIIWIFYGGNVTEHSELAEDSWGAVLDEIFHLDGHMRPQLSVYESMTLSLAEEIEFLNQTIKSRRSIGDC